MKMRWMALAAVFCLILGARADSLGSAMSALTALDLMVGPLEYALAEAETIPVEYGSLYGDVEDGEAQFLVNDEVVASGGEAAMYDWKPTAEGTYVLKHRMIVDGEEAGTVLTVTHIVTADPEPLPTCGSATSVSIALDLSVGTVEYALSDAETIPVEYGSLYGDVEDGEAQFLVNDEVVASGGEAAMYDWKPTSAGTYILKHRMLVDGEEAGTVLFARVEVTAQREQIKYVVDIDGVVDGDCAYGQQVTAATFAEKTEGYTNIVCLGWVGTGDVPATGVGTQVTFMVTQASSLKWVYQTNYWVQVEVEKVGGGGEIGGSVALYDAEGLRVHGNSGWFAAGTNLTAEVTANEGWLFAGWRTVDANVSFASGKTNDAFETNASTYAFDVDAPIFLEAVFTQKVFTVTFDLGGHGTRTGGGALEQTVVYGESAIAPTVAAEVGYVFTGWDWLFGSVTSNMTVTAQWECWVAEGCYGVQWNAAAGAAGRASWLPGRVYQLPPCTETPPEGKHFAGWLGSNDRRYDDRMLVFNLAEEGEVVVLTPIWE